MGENNPFGFDPEDLDRVFRDAGEGLRDLAAKIGRFVEQPDAGIPWASIFPDLAGAPRTRPAPPTAGETGDGVWVIYTLDDDGTARVEQVFPTELEALRAHKNNTDPRRSVRFLPYGVTAGILDRREEEDREEKDTDETG
ncbi:Uncharacterized protein Rruber_04921 [Rhodococcus ruber]|uniref:hypothetical protein n=1 Tax=Rhodococcus ruber TaxID=1830 RepID=UPI00315C7BA4